MFKLKKLLEKRAALKEQMESLLNQAEVEERAMNEEESAAFDEAEKEIRAIDETIQREQRLRGVGQVDGNGSNGTGDEGAQAEERAFADYVLGAGTENRALNMTLSANGAIIPTTIANRIIKAVKDICPILNGCTLYHVKGNLKVPVWGKASSTHDITVAYQTEFTAITSETGGFTSVDLGGYLAGALTLIGKSVENNAAFDVVGFIVQLMAEEIAAFLEKELLNGTSGKATGALSTTNSLTSVSSTTAVTADELIALQAKVKQAHQRNACWTMHPDTFTAIKKLKDGNNRYLLQDDVTGAFPYRLLGKPVYLSDNMPTMAASKKAILYGDYSGLSVNIREDISIQVLRERYADLHAVGVISWFEFDSKVTDHQKLAVLTMKAS